MATPLEALVARVRACTLCAIHLPFPPKPILHVHPQARLLIVGQAPGTRVHASGIPWDDPSGDRLRLWLGIPREAFYSNPAIAIIPTGLCYPGRDPRGGDRPPRPECAPLWHPQLLAHLPAIKRILLVGRHAQLHYLGQAAMPTLTETVRAWQRYLPRYIPIPHPSPRNNLWLRRHPWFESDVVPAFRKACLDGLTSP